MVKKNNTIPKNAKPAGKRITVPKTIDWGPNAPRDHLAYLNAREMEYLQGLRSFKGKRDYNGVPAFPDPGDTARGDTGKGTTSSHGSSATTDNSRGNTGRGAGSNYGSGSGRPGTGGGSSNLGGGNKGGSPGSQGSSVGGGNKGSTGTSSGMRGAGSNYGAGSTRPGSTTPASPMEGQRASFSSPSSAAGYNKDQAARQRSAVKDAASVVQSNRALKGDLQVGGIRSISVGPIGTTISVPRALTSAVSGPVNPAKTSIAGSITQSGFTPTGYYNTSAPLSADDLARRAAAMNAIQEQIQEEFSRVPKTGDPISAGGGLPAPKVPDKMDLSGTYGPVQEKIISIENVPPERPAYAAGTWTQSYDKPVALNKANQAAVDALRPVGRVSKFSTVGGIGDIYNPNAEFSESPKIPNWSQSGGTPKTRSATTKTRSATTENSPPIKQDAEKVPHQATTSGLSRESWTETPYGEPGDIQRKKDVFDKYAPKAPGLWGVAGWAASKARDAIWSGMSPQERMDQIERNNRMDQDRIRGLNGNENDRSARDSVLPPYQVNKPNSTNKPGDGFTEQEDTGGRGGERPEKYYYWDAGVDIPSPGDSDYTLYLKYLQEREAAIAAFG